jgi:hypothetical protein
MWLMNDFRNLLEIINHKERNAKNRRCDHINVAGTGLKLRLSTGKQQSLSLHVTSPKRGFRNLDRRGVVGVLIVCGGGVVPLPDRFRLATSIRQAV